MKSSNIYTNQCSGLEPYLKDRRSQTKKKKDIYTKHPEGYIYSQEYKDIVRYQELLKKNGDSDEDVLRERAKIIEKMTECYLLNIYWAAHLMYKKINHKCYFVEVWDLVNIGILGLYDALEKYNPYNKPIVRYETYAFSYRVVRSMRKLLSDYKTTPLRMDDVVLENGDDGRYIPEVVKNSMDGYKILEEKEILEKTRKMVDTCLSERKRQYIIWSFGLGYCEKKTYKEMGCKTELNRGAKKISRSAIYMHIKPAKEKLHKELTKGGKWECLGEMIQV